MEQVIHCKFLSTCTKQEFIFFYLFFLDRGVGRGEGERSDLPYFLHSALHRLTLFPSIWWNCNSQILSTVSSESKETKQNPARIMNGNMGMFQTLESTKWALWSWKEEIWQCEMLQNNKWLQVPLLLFVWCSLTYSMSLTYNQKGLNYLQL